MKKEQIVSALVLFVAGWCCSATLSASLATATQTSDELIQVLRASQPTPDVGAPCAEQQAAVDYWVAIVEAAENSLMDAWDDLDECLNGPVPPPVPRPNPTQIDIRALLPEPITTDDDAL